MDYDAIINETKKMLENYSSVNDELEELYRRAKEKNTLSYEDAKKSLDRQYKEDRNAAVTKGLMDEKDMQQFLAARGLAASGESVQAKIDSGLSVNNALAALSGENLRALSALEQDRLSTESKLDTELAGKKLEQERWEHELAARLVQLEQSEAASTKSSTSGSGNTPDESSNRTENSFVPQISAKEMAKNIISAYSSGGRIYSNLQKSQISLYLNDLEKKEGADPAYIKELLVNLKAAGYTEIPVSAAEATVAANQGESYYKRVYQKLFDIYHKGNNTLEQAKKLAVNKAKILLIGFLYERCSSISSFEKACGMAGISQEELNEYYRQTDNINENGNKLSLGSKISY